MSSLYYKFFLTQSLSMVQLKKFFFKYGVLPEWNTKAPFYCNTQTSSDFHGNTEPDDPCQNSSTSIDKWCYCGGPEEGQMICCDNKCVVSHRLFKDSYYSN